MKFLTHLNINSFYKAWVKAHFSILKKQNSKEIETRMIRSPSVKIKLELITKKSTKIYLNSPL